MVELDASPIEIKGRAEDPCMARIHRTGRLKFAPPGFHFMLFLNERDEIRRGSSSTRTSEQQDGDGGREDIALF